MATSPSRKPALAALLLSLSLGLAAMTVSVAPAEDGAYAPPPDGSGSPMRFLVSGCMGELFESGWIVTDAEASRLAREAWSPSGSVLAGAREGMVDYVVALYVDWAPSEFHKGTLLPASVAYGVVRVSDGRTIIEGEMRGSADSEETSSRFAETATLVGARVAKACAKPLKDLVMGGEK
jgi:hypothetical protein